MLVIVFRYGQVSGNSQLFDSNCKCVTKVKFEIYFKVDLKNELGLIILTIIILIRFHIIKERRIAISHVAELPIQDAVLQKNFIEKKPESYYVLLTLENFLQTPV